MSKWGLSHVVQGNWRKIHLMIFLLATFSGCSHSEPELDVATFPVKGKLLLAGKPATGASIFFVPVDHLEVYPATPPEHLVGATVDADGGFEVFTQGLHAGAPAGSYALAINWYEPPKIPDRDDDKRGKDLIPKMFQDARTSGIQVNVEAGSDGEAVVDLIMESQSKSRNQLLVSVE